MRQPGHVCAQAIVIALSTYVLTARYIRIPDQTRRIPSSTTHSDIQFVAQHVGTRNPATYRIAGPMSATVCRGAASSAKALLGTCLRGCAFASGFPPGSPLRRDVPGHSVAVEEEGSSRRSPAYEDTAEVSRWDGVGRAGEGGDVAYGGLEGYRRFAERYIKCLVGNERGCAAGVCRCRPMARTALSVGILLRCVIDMREDYPWIEDAFSRLLSALATS